MRHKKILVIAPHMDDEVLGCGGAIVRHVAAKDKVYVLFVASRIYGHRFDNQKNEIEREHALRAKQVLGYQEAIFLNLDDERLDAAVQDIIIPLEEYINKIKPDIVYSPFRGDNNQDHRAVFDALRVAARPMSAKFIQRLLMYEVLSSTEQSPPLYESAFLPNYYVDITRSIDKKIKAFLSYRTEKRTYPHPRSSQGLKALAKKRGMEIGFQYAEAFMSLREKWE